MTVDAELLDEEANALGEAECLPCHGTREHEERTRVGLDGLSL